MLMKNRETSYPSAIAIESSSVIPEAQVTGTWFPSRASAEPRPALRAREGPKDSEGPEVVRVVSIGEMMGINSWMVWKRYLVILVNSDKMYKF